MKKDSDVSTSVITAFPTNDAFLLLFAFIAIMQKINNKKLINNFLISMIF